MIKTVSVDVDVDIDLDEFDLDDLIEEVRNSGYIVLDEDDSLESFLTREELDYLIEKSSFADIGTIGYFANQKLRKYYRNPK
jgi:hypothetical protein